MKPPLTPLIGQTPGSLARTTPAPSTRSGTWRACSASWAKRPSRGRGANVNRYGDAVDVKRAADLYA